MNAPAGAASCDIRDSDASDLPSIVALYPRALPDGDLLGLVRHLLADRGTTISLLATLDLGDAWQSQILGNSEKPAGGTLRLPDYWLKPALWSA